MKVRAWHDNGVLRITSFAPGVDIPSVWVELVRRGDAKEPFVEIENTSLPPRVDANGISQRAQWKLSGNAVVVDPAIRNIPREIFDKQAQIDVIKAKGRNITATDLLELQKLQIELETLIAESRGG